MRNSIRQWAKSLGKTSAIALSVGVSLASAQDIGVTATEILLGEVQPMSGPASLIGKAGAAGSKLAIAEINDKGGINGRKLRAIYEDDGYVPSRSVSAVKKLIDSARLVVEGKSLFKDHPYRIGQLGVLLQLTL
jgi:ABC-type branched-subunit amino acid transport system substrate-binding protein